MTGQGKNALDTLLAESLKELAVTRPIEKITIKEITDKAGVIRPTFYNHFQDKFELIEWIIDEELLAPVRPLIQAGMITESMILIFTNISKEKVFYNRVVKLEGAITFKDIANKCVKRFLQEIIEKQFAGKGNGKSKYSWLNADVISTYYAQSMCFAAEQWITTGMVNEPKEMAEAYYYMLSHSMEQVVEDL